MKKYNNIIELIEDIENIPIPGALFIEKSKSLNINEAFYLTMSAKELKDENMIEVENDYLPENLRTEGVKSFFETDTFEDIISVQKEKNEESTTEDFINAIEYYREFDTFLD